nr:hypothetical protein [Rivibacter subsaxonicus]
MELCAVELVIARDGDDRAWPVVEQPRNGRVEADVSRQDEEVRFVRRLDERLLRRDKAAVLEVGRWRSEYSS